jgi:signal transduction histidine kinase
MVPEIANGDLIHSVRGILSNIARHAHASEVWVACAVRQGHTVVITIEDDGVGFEPESVTRGHGLRNIEERMKRLGGEFVITHRAPNGTVHTLAIPGKS